MELVLIFHHLYGILNIFISYQFISTSSPGNVFWYKIYRYKRVNLFKAGRAFLVLPRGGERDISVLNFLILAIALKQNWSFSFLGGQNIWWRHQIFLGCWILVLFQLLFLRKTEANSEIKKKTLLYVDLLDNWLIINVRLRVRKFKMKLFYFCKSSVLPHLTILNPFLFCTALFKNKEQKYCWIS